jgi:CRP/FNR family transcriptional regulator, cyclic AMP receptor protein
LDRSSSTTGAGAAGGGGHGKQRAMPMDFHLTGHFGVELVGYAAAAASLYAANSKTIIPLRVAAIVANLLAMAYSYNHGTIPSVLLNAVLLPINALRLYAMWRLIHDVQVAGQSDMNVNWLLNYMRPRQFKAGDVLMERGAIANEAFYVMSGEVEIVEIQRKVGSGTLVGEMGLFTDDGRRTMTVRCVTDVQAATITYDRFKELYFQNPQFGFYLLRLVVARMHSNGMQFAASGPPAGMM